ncbi:MULTISPECIES: hypothetical protein [unclassified Nonomuraea]|uniref:hypothetical protein n=1 Tax=unclassified Nonomuraea TaxID=2593643 RepID=UPI0033DDB73E
MSNDETRTVRLTLDVTDYDVAGLHDYRVRYHLKNTGWEGAEPIVVQATGGAPEYYLAP